MKTQNNTRCVMNREETGEYLYRFYNKRTTSFLASIYKASITNDAVDIHRARLDVKKIFTLLELFELIEPETRRWRKTNRIFIPLYRQAGKIREIQVNVLQLSRAEDRGIRVSALKEWLREEERLHIVKFLKQVRKFEDDELEDTRRTIKRICHSDMRLRLRSKTREYIRNKASHVRSLQLNDPGDTELHGIRKDLKSMATIATLVHAVKPDKEFDRIISALNRTEIMIGDWHDRIVLNDTIHRFMEKKRIVSAEETGVLNRLMEELTGECRNLVQHFMPEVQTALDLIMEEKN